MLSQHCAVPVKMEECSASCTAMMQEMLVWQPLPIAYLYVHRQCDARQQDHHVCKMHVH